jgi:hypothetical protein
MVSSFVFDVTWRRLHVTTRKKSFKISGKKMIKIQYLTTRLKELWTLAPADKFALSSFEWLAFVQAGNEMESPSWCRVTSSLVSRVILTPFPSRRTTHFIIRWEWFCFHNKKCDNFCCACAQYVCIQYAIFKVYWLCFFCNSNVVDFLNNWDITKRLTYKSQLKCFGHLRVRSLVSLMRCALELNIRKHRQDRLPGTGCWDAFC